MPPLESSSDYLELVAAVEDTASALGRPVVIEGYPIPFDPRLEKMSVTPDPGVIEVNVRPAASWSRARPRDDGALRGRAAARLSTEKFMLDGRHTGTGGGNHVMLGGPSPADSPFLRRPDLLAQPGRLLAEPSLALVPLLRSLHRPDEPGAARRRGAAGQRLRARDRVPAGVGRAPGERPPWLVDRIFRNLLVDVTGNTHRTEFCIDKLYSPERASGRLGLVELRAFEMPPHARMSLAQQLLVRALVARFWREPYRRAPGALGHAAPRSLPLAALRRRRTCAACSRSCGARATRSSAAGSTRSSSSASRRSAPSRRAASSSSCAPRSSRGTCSARSRRPAVPSATWTRRSSACRCGCAVSSRTASCSPATAGALPLHPTGAAGEFVAGVRYRAWQPPTCLHPTIPVHAPLVFDVVDAWRRALARRLHLSRRAPGRARYETFPVNAYEAEARRGARFVPLGHTPGALPVPPLERNPDIPLTLDLLLGARR